jgi:hypothetical protein
MIGSCRCAGIISRVSATPAEAVSSPDVDGASPGCHHGRTIRETFDHREQRPDLPVLAVK